MIWRIKKYLKWLKNQIISFNKKGGGYDYLN